MEVAEHGVTTFDDIAIELHLQSKHTMCRRVRRPDIESHGLTLKFGFMLIGASTKIAYRNFFCGRRHICKLVGRFLLLLCPALVASARLRLTHGTIGR